MYDYYIYVYNPETPTWDTFDQSPAQLCHRQEPQSPPILNVACPKHIIGRYLKIYKVGGTVNEYDTLTLCEVEIYGDDAINNDKDKEKGS